MTKTYTLADARAEKHRFNDKLFAKFDALATEAARRQEILTKYRQIGTITKADGSTAYYVYPVGGGYEERRNPSNLIRFITKRRSTT